MQTTKYEKLFSTPFFRFRLDDATILNAQLVSEGERLRKLSDGVEKSNRNGWHSSGNLFKEPAKCFQSLRKCASRAIETANTKIGAKADLDAFQLKLFAWMNANPMGGFNAPHTHPGAHWSGVYYVAQPDVSEGNSGMIELIDPRSDLPNWRLLKAPPFKLKKKIRPEPGELILFPSYLVHWVYPNESNKERWTIAFNATFKRAAGRTQISNSQEPSFGQDESEVDNG